MKTILGMAILFIFVVVPPAMAQGVNTVIENEANPLVKGQAIGTLTKTVTDMSDLTAGEACDLLNSSNDNQIQTLNILASLDVQLVFASGSNSTEPILAEGYDSVEPGLIIGVIFTAGVIVILVVKHKMG